MPAPSPSAPAARGGYLFATFAGETTPLTEQVYLALSADGRDWEVLNGSQPVLVSRIGERGVRDPFLLRAQNGEGFYLLATDLSIHHNPEWRRAATAGSRSILVWQTEDLVRWSEPRRVEVAAPDAGCAWAPEAVFDEQSGQYLVFWSSANRRDDFAKFRIWAAHTPDFRSFTEPFIYVDREHAVIDASIIREGARYYRFIKNEERRAIALETAESLMGPWRAMDSFSLRDAEGYEGPACFELEPASPDRPAAWCLLLDHFTIGAGYEPFITHDLAGGNFSPAPGIRFPFRFRHGSVLALSGEEYSRLKHAYPR